MWDHSFSPSILNNWVQRSVVMNTPMTYTFTVFSLHLPFSQVRLPFQHLVLDEEPSSETQTLQELTFAGPVLHHVHAHSPVLGTMY